MSYLLHKSKAAADATERMLFADYCRKIREIDPDAVADDGTIIGRNAATGELEPNATRTTGWAAPVAVVEGFTLSRGDLTTTVPGAIETEQVTPWPAPVPGREPPEVSAWVKPTGYHNTYQEGAWVEHGGQHYVSLHDGNDQEPMWPSLFWQAVPEPQAPEWRKPTGYQNVYPKGAAVTHNGQEWESLIAANNEEPGADRTNRYWAPFAAGDGPAEWSQPMPGGHRPYGKGEKCIHGGQTWRSKVPLNVWEPAAGALWELAP